MKTDTIKTAVRYVAGFMFDADFNYVALIRKNKPEWQRGKLNGIGGKIEEGETALQAMVREFAEETATETACSQWERFCTLRSRDESENPWSVAFFACTGDVNKLKTNESEPIEIIGLRDIHPTKGDMIENLPWLIPMAIDCLQDGRPGFVEVQYPS